MRVLCVGAGPAGLLFAILMKQSDPTHDVLVLERKCRGSTEGFGVVFWDDLLEDLRAVDPSAAERVRAEAYGWRGQVLERLGERVEHEGCGYGMARSQFCNVLAERATDFGVKIEFDRLLTAARELPDADLIVASDGANSVVRQFDDRFGTTAEIGRNKYVWLGTHKVFDAFTFAFVPTSAGWLWFHAYAFDDETSTCIVECTPETWRSLGFHQASANESLRLLEDIFARHLDGEKLAAPCAGEAMLPWLNFRTISNRRWFSDRTVLVGDAAHTTHFSIGSGTQLALQDARALAHELQTHDALESAFAAYEARRRDAISRPQNDARLSARWYENVSRYESLPAPAFFMSMRARRDPILPRVPPRVFSMLYTASDRVAILRAARHRVGRATRVVMSRRRRRQ